MAQWKARPAPAKTSITTIARTYHSCAYALAQSLGISLAEVLEKYHTGVASIFIEASRCDLRLPASVKLPTIAPAGEPSSGHHTGQPVADNATPVGWTKASGGGKGPRGRGVSLGS